MKQIKFQAREEANRNDERNWKLSPNINLNKLRKKRSVHLITLSLAQPRTVSYFSRDLRPNWTRVVTNSFALWFTAKQRVGTPQLNHITMRMPTFPLMSQTELVDSSEFCNASTIGDNCRTEYCSCPHVLQVKLNSVVELILVDEGECWTINN